MTTLSICDLIRKKGNIYIIYLSDLTANEISWELKVNENIDPYTREYGVPHAHLTAGNYKFETSQFITIGDNEYFVLAIDFDCVRMQQHTKNI